MKLEMKSFEVDIQKDETYKVNEGGNDVYRNLKCTPFVYGSPDPKQFKLVLSWEFLLKQNDEQGKQIIKAYGEHPFIITLEEDNKHDRVVIDNAVGVSYMHLQAELFDFLKRKGLLSIWENFDTSAATDQILSHFPKKG